MRFGLRKRGICNDLQASTMAGTPFGWGVRSLRLVRRAPNTLVVRRTSRNNLTQSVSCEWDWRPRTSRRACIFLVLYKLSRPNAAMHRTVLVPACISGWRERTGIYRDCPCCRLWPQIHLPSSSSQVAPVPRPHRRSGDGNRLGLLLKTYIVDGMAVSILFLRAAMRAAARLGDSRRRRYSCARHAGVAEWQTQRT